MTGCGGTGQQASEQTVGSTESRQEPSQQADEQENTAEEENEVGLDEPYVLVRETFTSNGTVTEYGYDENGDKISETVSYPDKPDETLYREYTTQYQEDGSKIVTESQTMLQATGEAISNATYEYDYNPEGLLVRKAGFYDGQLDGEVTYEYDENGNLTYQSETKATSLGNAMAKKCEYDLVLLDVMLPKMDGFEVCQQIREFSDMPIVMLTAKSEDMDKILGLEYGADDYMTKPFNIVELKARVKAILRRTRSVKEKKGNTLEIRGLTIDFDSRTVFVEGKEVNLTAKEFDLLELLARNVGKVYSREKLLDIVWGYDYPGDVRTVDVHVRRLREKIEPNSSEPTFIQTKWGVGYFFKD